jgi:hypothetical protein
MSEIIGRKHTEAIVIEDSRMGKGDIVLAPRKGGFWGGDLSPDTQLYIGQKEEYYGLSINYNYLELTREEAWRLYLVLEEVFTG